METDKKDITFADFQAHERAVAIGKRYLNIFHQLHVINAGIEVLNRDFLSLPDDVVKILPELSGGLKFYQHIQNLKNGITPINKIEVDLLPFGKNVFDSEEKFHEYTDGAGGASSTSSYSSATTSSPSGMNLGVNPANSTPSSTQGIGAGTSGTSGATVAPASAQSPSAPRSMTEPTMGGIGSSSDDNEALFSLLRGFKSTTQNLADFKQSEVIRDLGPNWKIEINKILTLTQVQDRVILKRNFDTLCIFDTALGVWEECVAIVKNPRMKSPSEISANLANYKKYLAMFGNGGRDLLAKVQSLAG